MRSSVANSRLDGTRCPARIVFNRRHRRFDTVLVPLEIHVADLLLVALPDAAARNPAIAIASARLLAGKNQALFRLALGDVVVRRNGHISR